MANDNEKIDHLKQLKRKLYQRGIDIRPRKKKVLRPIERGIPSTWSTESSSKEGAKRRIVNSSIFKKFFVFSLVVFGASLIFASFMFFGGGNIVSNENIDIEILGNAFVDGGEELPLQIEVTNRNNADLEFSDLLIEYPKGSSGEVEGDFVRIRQSLGTIDAGRTATQSVKVTLFGEEGSIKDIRIALEYRIKGSNAIFVKEERFPVTISSAPITLSVEAPSETSPNQEITLNIRTVLNAERIIEDIRLRAEYPPGFEFKSSTPEPTLGNNVWDLGDLSLGVSKNISIKGFIRGQEGEERSFRVYTGEEDAKDPTQISVVYSSLLHTVAVKRAFIGVRLLVDGTYKDEYVSASQKNISAEITWANNLSTQVQDVEIKATLSGTALDKNAVKVLGGFYNSIDNTITWDKNTSSNFSAVEPGQSGVESFSLASLPLFSGTQSLIENPEIIVDVSIRGRESVGGEFQEVISAERKIIKIVSDLQIAVKALHRTGPFSNSGPMPPQAEKETKYTILWNVTNSSNKITGALAKATLPSYIRFSGLVSPSTEDVSYDPLTREVTWDIGTVDKGTGLVTGSKEVAFQIILLPSLSQVGNTPTLISETKLTGQDIFANIIVQSRKASLNTRLSNDPGFVQGEDEVVQ